MTGAVHVTRYQVAAPLERDRLIAALKTVLKIKHTPPLHSNYDWFAFAPGDPIQTGEPFYWQSIRRAFGFKGSPSEMRDVLRLACRLGRIGAGKDIAGQPSAAMTVADYAKQFFSPRLQWIRRQLLGTVSRSPPKQLGRDHADDRGAGAEKDRRWRLLERLGQGGSKNA
jgi:hypothetical protein